MRSRWMTIGGVLLLLFLMLLVWAGRGCFQPEPDPTPTPTTPATPTPSVTSPPPPTQSSSDSSLEALPDIVYLGAGPGSYSVPPGFNFIVKRPIPFRFESEPGPDYTAAFRERVWQVRGSGPLFAVYEAEHDFGMVHPGCIVRYLQIDDDVDSRRNRFFVDGQEIHLLPQGMTVSGEFTVTASGRLTLFAEDSIGATIEVNCPPPPTNTPTAVPPTATLRPTRTATPPGRIEPTPTATLPTSINPPGGVTPTFTPEILPTTPPPTLVATLPPSPTPSPTVPTGPAFTRFNFEMAGHAGRDGFCYMHRDTGELLLVWQMQAGWTDSSTHPDADANGWIPVMIPHVSIYVEVFCDDGSGRVRMDIYNGVAHPVNGRIVGWLTRGIHNAIEIGWPE